MSTLNKNEFKELLFEWRQLLSETSPAYLHLLFEDTFDVVLQEFNFLNFKDSPEYNQVIKLIKDIYGKVNDRLKRKILSNHNYIFESHVLKKYIKLVLS
tara:strand:+ start:99 stop:395 length:297 start_codon:yes stop_codon:yes gene_type:complete